MDFTIKYKQDSKIGMVCEREALSVLVSSVDAIEAIKTFAIDKANDGFTNNTYNLADTINYINGLSPVTAEEMIHEINTLYFTKEGKEMLVISIE